MKPGLVAATVLLAVAALCPGATAYKDVLIPGVPHVKQKPDFCGEACAEMYLKKLGNPLSQDDVFNLSGLDPLLGRGCYAQELLAALRKVGFKTGEAWAKVDAAKAAEELEGQWKNLYADLAAGVPCIVCMHYSDQPKSPEHFRLVLGYESKTDEVIYHEPAEENGAYRHMKRETFLKLWPLKGQADRWTLIRLRLEPGTLIQAPPRAGFTNADYVQHIMALKKKAPPGFTMVIQPPFVVLGDGGAQAVQQSAQFTVKWAVDKLKQDYFTKDPDDLIDVWLFKDTASYNKYTKEIFDDTPTTPYGYYSSENQALIMNIGTGGGTLVHEIVHPFVRVNFPDCPAWFNEGLGSLYEQAAEKGGHIQGRTNWRLAGLQKAIKSGGVPSFKILTGTSTSEFYNGDRGTNYAQARYLCYYLQEKELLVKFYKSFLAAHKDDPTGYQTLKKILGLKDDAEMEAFKKDWQAFVLKLQFP